jgi:hypothetical protein
MTRRIFEWAKGMGLAAAAIGTMIVGGMWLSDCAFAASAREIDWRRRSHCMPLSALLLRIQRFAHHNHNRVPIRRDI